MHIKTRNWRGRWVWYATVHGTQNLGQNGCQNRRQVWRKPNQPSAGILINFSIVVYDQATQLLADDVTISPGGDN